MIRGEDAPPPTLIVGCGFIGRRVVRHLVAAGGSVRVINRSPLPEIAGLGRDRLLVGDAGTPILGRALDGVEEVVYCIGGLLPASAQADPVRDLELMLGPLKALLSALRARPGVGLTFVSSGGAVYGNPQCLPVREDHPTVPIGAYGAARVAAEHLVRAAAADGLWARILRCANVYGEDQPVDRGQGAVAVMSDRVRRGEPVTLFGDGSAVRDYIYVGDVADVIVGLLGRHDGDPILNVGTGVGTSVRELLTAIETLLESRASVVMCPRRLFDVDQIVLDIALLRTVVSFTPIPLMDGLERTLRAVTQTVPSRLVA